LIASTALVLGFCAGGWVGVRYWQSVDEERMTWQFLSDAKTHTAILTDMQNSNQKQVVLLLESKLDTDVVGISLMLESPDLKCEATELLSTIAQYRKSTNYRSTNDYVALKVSQALERVVQPNPAIKRDALKCAP
jgi:hypothetical protein